MSAQSGSPRRPPFGDVAPAFRISKARELGGSLSVTVKTSMLLQVRRAIVQSGVERIGIVKAVPLACGTRVRLLVALPRESLDHVMDCIMQAVGAGEFGRAGGTA